MRLNKVFFREQFMMVVFWFVRTLFPAEAHRYYGMHSAKQRASVGRALSVELPSGVR